MVITITTTVGGARVTELSKTSLKIIEQYASYPRGKVVHFPGLGAEVVVVMEYNIGNEVEGQLRLASA